MATISGSRAVTSLRFRVKTRTSAPRRGGPGCGHRRASTPRSPRRPRPFAAATDSLVDASIGRTGRSGSRPMAATASSPSTRAMRATDSEVAGEHHRPPHHADTDARGDSDGVGHDAGEGAGPHLADEQPTEEVGLGGGGPAEQVERAAPSAGLGTGTRRGRQLVDRPVDVVDGRASAAAAGATSRSADRGPSDADAALADLAEAGTRRRWRPRRARAVEAARPAPPSSRSACVVDVTAAAHRRRPAGVTGCTSPSAPGRPRPARRWPG